MRRRWSTASRVYAALAVVCGLAAFLLVRTYAARVEALAPVMGPPSPVVVAAAAVTRGTQLTPTMLRVIQVPGAYAPPGALTRVGQAVGRTTLTSLAAGEPLTRTRVGAAGAGPIASLVPSGMRAFAVAADVPAGSVRPGDRVDVLATFGGGQAHVETAGTAMEVLAVLSGSSGGLPTTASTGTASGGPTLVLAVTPDQANELAYAKAFADLTVAIVGADEGP